MTILETVIAASLIAVAIVAGLSLATSTGRETSYARDLSLATKYNTQGVDQLKSLRSQMGWFAFVGAIQADGGSPYYCLSEIPDTSEAFNDLPSANQSTCALQNIGGTTFYRTATLTVASPPDYVDVVITTYFGGDSERSVATETRLSNY